MFKIKRIFRNLLTSGQRSVFLFLVVLKIVLEFHIFYAGFSVNHEMHFSLQHKLFLTFIYEQCTSNNRRGLQCRIYFKNVIFCLTDRRERSGESLDYMCTVYKAIFSTCLKSTSDKETRRMNLEAFVNMRQRRTGNSRRK